MRAYLPSYETVTIFHLRDLAMSVKIIIPCDEVKVIDVPQFEGLTIQTMFDFAKSKQAVENALPPPKEIAKLSRAYLANVIYTILGQRFQDWVTHQVNARNQRVAQEGNNVIQMDPRIAAIFHQSTAISGKFRFLDDIFILSLQGQVLASDEGFGEQAQVPSPDRAGEA